MAATQYLYMQQGRPIAQRSSGSAKVYQYDGMGSVRQMVDKNGTVTDTFRFDMFGEVVSRTGTTKTPFSWNIGAGMQTGPDGLYVQQLGNGSSPFTMPPIWAPGGRGGRVWGGSTGLEFGPPFGRPTVEFRDGIIWIQYGDGSWTKIGPPHPIIGSIDRIIGVRIGPGQIVGPPAWQPPPTVLPPPGSGPPPAVVPPPGGGRTGPPIGGATDATSGLCTPVTKCSDLEGTQGACIALLCSIKSVKDLIDAIKEIVGAQEVLDLPLEIIRGQVIEILADMIGGGSDPAPLDPEECCKRVSRMKGDGRDAVFGGLEGAIAWICKSQAGFLGQPSFCATVTDNLGDCLSCCTSISRGIPSHFGKCEIRCRWDFGN